MSDPRTTDDQQSKEKQGCIGCWGVGAIIGILILFCGVGLGPINSNKRAPESASVQTVRLLGLAMFGYSVDNNNEYPTGKSSTEVFQKLLDGGYVSDPAIFYIPMAGKVAPTPDQKKLKPENVSWDVTSDADASSPDTLPLVFMTGYKVTYTTGGSAIPLLKPYPRFDWLDPNQSWSDWLLGQPTIRWYDSRGLAVFYKANNAKWINLETAPNGDGSIPNFVPPDFKPDGKTYRQLTPDGVLP